MTKPALPPSPSPSAPPATTLVAPPPPDATFTVSEVARHANVSLRTIRHYVSEKVVPAPAFRSSRTRYERSFLVRLRAALVLRQQRLSLPDVRQRLERMPVAELMQLAGYTPDAPAHGTGDAAAPPGEPAGARTDAASAVPAGAAQAGPAAFAPRPLPAGYFGPYRGSAAAPHERWEHFDVCPGVKVLVRSEADPEAWRVAREMLALFTQPAP